MPMREVWSDYLAAPRGHKWIPWFGYTAAISFELSPLPYRPYVPWGLIDRAFIGLILKAYIHFISRKDTP